MGPPKKDSSHELDSLRSSCKKVLWGIRRNQEKIQSLAELTTTNIDKALALKRSEMAQLKKRSRRRAKEPDPRSQLEKEILCLEKDRQILERLFKNLDRCYKRWPLPEVQEMRPDETKAEAAPGKQTILVIDDEKVATKSITHFLRQKDYAVVAAYNAEAGLKKVTSEKPDLIVCDIMMPGMNGYHFITTVKEQPETAHIPVVIVSSLSRESDILEGLDRGAVDYIVKPYSPRLLISKIAKILASP